MNWADLPLLLAIAEAGSLGGAAERLSIDTSTVSRRLRALESQLGAKLFEPRGRIQVPTTAGRLALTTASEVDTTVKDLESRLMGLDERLSGSLRVTCSPSIAHYALMQPLADFRRAYPQIRIDLVVTDKMVDLLAREADVAIRVTTDPQPSLVGRAAGNLSYGVYASPAYLEQHDGGSHDYITWRGDQPRPGAIERVCPQAQVALKVDDLSAMVRAAQTGLGLALLPRVIGMSEPELVCVALDPTDYQYRTWVLRPATLQGSARVRVFADHVFEALRAQLRAAWALDSAA